MTEDAPPKENPPPEDQEEIWRREHMRKRLAWELDPTNFTLRGSRLPKA